MSVPMYEKLGFIKFVSLAEECYVKVAKITSVEISKKDATFTVFTSNKSRIMQNDCNLTAEDIFAEMERIQKRHRGKSAISKNKKNQLVLNLKETEAPLSEEPLPEELLSEAPTCEVPLPGDPAMISSGALGVQKELEDAAWKRQLTDAILKSLNKNKYHGVEQIQKRLKTEYPHVYARLSLHPEWSIEDVVASWREKDCPPEVKFNSSGDVKGLKRCKRTLKDSWAGRILYILNTYSSPSHPLFSSDVERWMFHHYPEVCEGMDARGAIGSALHTMRKNMSHARFRYEASSNGLKHWMVPITK